MYSFLNPHYWIFFIPVIEHIYIHKQGLRLNIMNNIFLRVERLSLTRIYIFVCFELIVIIKSNSISSIISLIICTLQEKLNKPKS